MVIQRGQRTVAETEEPGVNIPLVTLDTLALQVQLGFGGHDTYVDVNDKNIFYYVDCSVIQDYGQVETFDNEHTVYERIKIGTADATLGTSNNGGRTGYVLVWEKDGISHTIIGKIPREEILKIAESIS